MNDAYDILYKAYGHACNVLRSQISYLELIQTLPSLNPAAEDNPVYVKGRIDAYRDVIEGLEAAMAKAAERRAK